MVVENQKIEMRWNPKNIKWYEEKGYVYTKWKEPFLINIEDLPESSDKMVKFICDFCGVDFERKWKYYTRNIKRNPTILKDSCDNETCNKAKIKESNLINYGVISTMQLEEIKDKIKDTCLEKYGVEKYAQSEDFSIKYKQSCIDKYGFENAFQSEEVKNKIKQFNLDNYGVEYYSQTDEYKDKYKNTCLKIYGVENASQNKEIRNKFTNTMIKKYGVKTPLESEDILNRMNKDIEEKYGVSNISQIEEVKIKKAETFYKNGTIATSNQQRYVWKIIGGELNYSNNTPSLDIGFPNEKLYVEVNGSGHNLPVKTGWMTKDVFDSKERRRYYYLKNQGWNAIFINTPCDYLPSDNIILEEINKAKEWFKTEEKCHSHYNINIGKLINDVNYGKLRRIKKQDLERFEEAM